jgi:sulfite dehydrogenase
MRIVLGWLLLVLMVAVIGVGATACGGDDDEGAEPTTTEETTDGGTTAAGREIFVANCGSCHTLKDAGTNGQVGPNLDQAKPSRDLIIDRVTNGKGVMPPFKGQLSDKQIADVAAFVFASTH